MLMARSVARPRSLHASEPLADARRKSPPVSRRRRGERQARAGEAGSKPNRPRPKRARAAQLDGLTIESIQHVIVHVGP
jgi:hypothetical protein